jgi:hypothetical protein
MLLTEHRPFYLQFKHREYHSRKDNEGIAKVVHTQMPHTPCTCMNAILSKLIHPAFLIALLILKCPGARNSLATFPVYDSVGAVVVVNAI